MIQENELVTLILGIAVLLFYAAGRSRLRELPAWRVFIASYCIYSAGLILTVVEGLWYGTELGPLLGAVLNAFEHTCYAASSVLLAVWCWRVSRPVPEADR